MKTVVVEIDLEPFKLSLLIDRVRGQRLVMKLVSNGPDHAIGVAGAPELIDTSV